DSAAETPENCGIFRRRKGRAAMSRRIHVPSYREHKQSGQAIVTLTDGAGGRRDVLLGKHGTAASLAEYHRVVTEWEAAGRSVPTAPAAADITIAELLARFLEHA